MTLSASDAQDLVVSFLTSFGARDLGRAGSMISPGFTMTFPGPKSFSSLESFAEWAKRRLKRSENHYERFDVVLGEDESIVYVLGTISGELSDGVGFEGIRFVDRFVIRDRLIRRMDAWSDLGELIGNRKTAAAS